MDCALYDIFCKILSNRQILAPTDIIAIMLTCSRFRNWATSHLTDSAALSNGYPQRESLISTFTCYCRQRGWNIRYHCECFVECTCCKRSRPIKLLYWFSTVGPFCIFPCRNGCSQCKRDMTVDNTSDFNFAVGRLICKYHKAPNPTLYKIEHADSSFARGINKIHNGPIPWDLIAEYDPDHPLLIFYKNSSVPGAEGDSGATRPIGQGRPRGH